MTRRIVLDTDLGMGAPGSDVDDGFALALALTDPELSVDLVTTVGGNSDVDTSTRLTRDLLAMLGRPQVPVVAGAGRPLLDDAPGSAEVNAAARAMVEHVMAVPGEVTVVAIGPLTNVATAVLLDPLFARTVDEVVVMGGVFLEHTNLAAMPGEYNVWCDPPAAQTVLDSGARVRFVGLDVTNRVRLSRDDAARLAASGTSFGALAGAATSDWIDRHGAWNPGDPREQDSTALHDPLAVAVVTHPELCTWRPAHVAVESEGRVARGVCVADLLTGHEPPEPNCRIAVGVDVDGFLNLFHQRVDSL